MAELAAAGPFISFVVEQLIQESGFLHGVGDQVEQMRTELTDMQCYLKDADARREKGNELVSNCISEIRELSLDAEDVIVTFVVKVANMRRGRIHRMLNIFGELRARHKVGLKILDINKTIMGYTRRLQTYGIQPANARQESSTSSSERVRQLRQSFPHVVEEDIVGLDEDVKVVVDQLVNKVSNNCGVVSICGMGGLGKTTLAKTVFHHKDVRDHFDCFAWAYISQQCKTRDVLEEILINLTSPTPIGREEIQKLKFAELVEKLYRVQSDKKCLVILDDIWKCEDWDGLSPGFPTIKTAVGSKILLTTRIGEVGFHVDQQCLLHELRHLTENESWELFQKKVSLRREEFILNTEMTVLGGKMVKHCGGLPLAIVVLGGLLATKPTLADWENMSRNVEDHIGKGKRQGVPVESVLELSYNDLPYHLKASFLCLSDLPEDEGIRPIKLVQRWMAEGFVSLPKQARREEAKYETLLDVGMSYLDELRQRCVIQVGQLTRFSRRVKFYRLHDLVRDLCMSKAQKENFLKVVFLGEDIATGTSSMSSSTRIRRLGVYFKANQTASDSERKGYVKPLSVYKTCNLHHVRACQFYFFNELEDSGWQHVKSIFKGFKLIRYLDLGKLIRFIGSGRKMPKAIGNLIQLRFLSIRDSYFSGLPSSIGNLRFLETLDLRCTCWTIVVPNVLWRLEQLRHLYLPNIRESWPFKFKLRLDGLYNLETLEGFDTGDFDMRSFSTLVNLRKLQVLVSHPKDLALILESPNFSNSSGLLRYSSIHIGGFYDTQEEESLFRQVLRYHHVHKLSYSGILTELPNEFPPKLTRLSLQVRAVLNEDPMPILEKLPNLNHLVLAWACEKMVCSAGGFPHLINLELYCRDYLEEWRVELGAMPSLTDLSIHGCQKLKKIPDGLRFVTTLQRLRISFPSQELEDRLREGGEDFPKFQHVHSIVILP